MKLKALLAISLLVIPICLISLTTWTGKVGSYWTYPDNWDTGAVPDSTTDVVIPAGTKFSPEEAYSFCRNLTIKADATLTVQRDKLSVLGDLNCAGTLVLGHTKNNTVFLKVRGDINWLDGSKAKDATFTSIHCEGNMTIAAKADVQLAEGSLTFSGAGNSVFTNHAKATRLNMLLSHKKRPASFTISKACTQGFIIGSHYQNNPGCLAYNEFDGPIWLYGRSGWIADQNNREGEDGAMLWNAGSLIVVGHNGSINISGKGSHLHNLYISGNYPGSVTLNHDLTLSGNLVLEGENSLAAKDRTISVAGTWTNRVGEQAFNQGTSTVRFTGKNPSRISSSETFYNLELDKPDGMLIIDSGAELTCKSYNWTTGGIEVIDGSFKAASLADKGISGNYICQIKGRIELSVDDQIPGSADLCGTLDIRGGTMTINTGKAVSSWPGASSAKLIMSSGVLDFQGGGIHILRPGNRFFNCTITGGTIRTNGNFVCANPAFKPQRGHLSLSGSTNTSLDMQAGSLNHLIISKTRLENTCDLSNDLISRDAPSIIKGSLNLNGFQVKPITMKHSLSPTE